MLIWKRYHEFESYRAENTAAFHQVCRQWRACQNRIKQVQKQVQNWTENKEEISPEVVLENRELQLTSSATSPLVTSPSTGHDDTAPGTTARVTPEPQQLEIQIQIQPQPQPQPQQQQRPAAVANSAFSLHQHRHHHHHPRDPQQQQQLPGHTAAAPEQFPAVLATGRMPPPSQHQPHHRSSSSARQSCTGGSPTDPSPATHIHSFLSPRLGPSSPAPTTTTTTSGSSANTGPNTAALSTTTPTAKQTGGGSFFS
ncbi:hypothetical protein Pelo_16826 [Pelomyxa schiedti]|nr:hypothetical protein Pelo_16826 [Pelomyxa schiedti]